MSNGKVITPGVLNLSSITNREKNEEKWRLRSLKEILNRQEEELDWIIQGILLDKSGCLSSGLPHSGKSLNWLCACLESVTTKQVWNQFKVRNVRNALFIETEDPPFLVEQRVRELSIGLGISATNPPEGFHLATPGPFDLAKGGQSWIFRAIEEAKADWVVLSTLQGLIAGLDWKEQQDMGVVNAALVEVSRICPLVVITHSPWNTKIRRAAGTVTQAANYLSALHFEKRFNDDGQTITTAWLDTKVGEPSEFKLALNLAIGQDRYGDPRTELRSITYIKEDKRSLINAYMLEHPDADNLEIAKACACTVQYVRKIKRTEIEEMLAKKRAN